MTKINVISKDDILKSDKYKPSEPGYVDVSEVKKAIFHLVKSKTNLHNFVCDIMDFNDEELKHLNKLKNTKYELTKSYEIVTLEQQIQKLWGSRGYTEIAEKFHTEDGKHIWTITCKKTKS